MRISKRITIKRILALGAGALLAASLATVTSETAYAANKITVTSPGAQLTDPLSTPVSLQIKATDSAKSTLTYTATGLPAGLAIRKTTGLISGTITVAKTYSVKVTVTDATKATGSASFSWTAKNTITVANPGNQVTAVGAPVSLAVDAADDDKGTSLTWSATGLPAGLAISAAAGVITGVPTKPGTSTVTVKVSDGTGSAASVAFTWKVANLITVTSPGTVQAWVGVPVSLKIKATDSDPAQQLTYTATGLPGGLSINHASGVITGTPAKISRSTVTVTVTDGAQSAGNAAFRLLAGEAITIPGIGRVATNAGLSVTVHVSYSDAARGDRVTLAVRGLPRGMAFDPATAAIYGWVAKPGDYPVTIDAKGSLGDSRSRSFPLVVKPGLTRGPAGQIRLDLGGKCLDDTGKTAGASTRVVLWSCRPGAAQQWTLAADGTIRVGTRCLEVSGTSYLGKAVQLYTCDEGSARETWVTGTAGQLVNAATGLCLADAKPSAPNAAIPSLGKCRVTSSQAWILPAHRILSGRSGKCVDDLHSSGVNGNVIDMYTCNGTISQDWTVEPDFTLRIFGNKCLTDPARPGTIGAKIELWTCIRGDKAQKLIVKYTGGLSSELIIGGACVAVPSMTAADPARLVTAKCTGTSPLVHWRIW
jgi:hypothetical protein